MASHKYRSALLDALNEKEVLIETTPQEVLSLIGVKAPSHPLLAISNKELLLEGSLTLDLYKLPLGVWAPRFLWC